VVTATVTDTRTYRSGTLFHQGGSAENVRVDQHVRSLQAGHEPLMNTQFAVAVQIMAVLAAIPDTAQTSVEIASRLGKNPAFLRRITSQLVEASLLRVRQKHSGGYLLARPADTITLGEVYRTIVHRANVNIRRANLATRETEAIDRALEAIVQSASQKQVSALGAIKLTEVL
jgi:Rrf2 family protein